MSLSEVSKLVLSHDRFLIYAPDAFNDANISIPEKFKFKLRKCLPKY